MIQEELDSIDVRIVPREGTDGPTPETLDAIASHIREAMGADCRVDFTFVREIEPTGTGKHLTVVSKVDRGSASNRGSAVGHHSLPGGGSSSGGGSPSDGGSSSLDDSPSSDDSASPDDSPTSSR